MVLRVGLLGLGQPLSGARDQGSAARGRALIEGENQFIRHVNHLGAHSHGRIGGVLRFRAPGRVNLIGEHVDYAGGLALPVALEQGVELQGTSTDDGVVRLASAAFSGAAVVDLSDIEADQKGWARFVAAVVAELVDYGIRVRGFAGELTSDLPAGSGLSSSAALEVCVAGALAHEAGVELAGMELALLAQRAENRSGIPCGIMDQAASALGRRDHAVLLDCATLDNRLVPMPDGIAIAVVGSGVRRRLAETGYAERRREVEHVLALVSEEERSHGEEVALRAGRAAGLDERELRRLRHVVTESERVRAVVREFERPEGPDLDELGRLFAAGHASLRDDFEVSVPEIDLLVDIAVEEGAIAARMTGGGFGGSIVALAPTAIVGDLAERVVGRYASQGGLTASVLLSAAGEGASLVGSL
jgi:galactokinase